MTDFSNQTHGSTMPVPTWDRNSHQRVPLMESLQRFRDQLHAPFYCPGHKGGRTLPPELATSFGALDLNNLPDTDTLHCPSGPILEAEELLADAYGVDKSYFMVGGSSLGNMAAIMATVGPGDTLLVQRNAHKSVVAGIIHSGASPVWLAPAWDVSHGLAHGLPTKTVEDALTQYPHAKALMVLNPTYFGVVPNFRSIADRVRSTETILIADEAHGPHFRFGQDYPLAAESARADIVVQSTHKILSGLSQAAALHVNTGKVDGSRVQAALQSLQTTSPNFAILASIDLARRQMVLEGHSRLAELLNLARETRQRIGTVAGLHLLDKCHSPGPDSGFFDLDPTKLLIDVSQTGWSGSDAQIFLNRQFGVQPELSGPGYLLCIMTVGSNRQDCDRLLQGLQALVETQPPRRVFHQQLNELAGRATMCMPEMVMSPRDAFYSRHENLSLDQALGCISGEVITPYPPGIPVIMPGERFDQATVDLLHSVKHLGCPISAVDPSLSTVRVTRSATLRLGMHRRDASHRRSGQIDLQEAIN